MSLSTFDTSAPPRVGESDTVPSLSGNFHRIAQSDPDVTFGDAGGQRLVSGSVPEPVEHEIAKKGSPVLVAELGGHRPSEFTRSHRDSIRDGAERRAPHHRRAQASTQ